MTLPRNGQFSRLERTDRQATESSDLTNSSRRGSILFFAIVRFGSIVMALINTLTYLIFCIDGSSINVNYTETGSVRRVESGGTVTTSRLSNQVRSYTTPREFII
jgi:hypothetical protein